MPDAPPLEAWHCCGLIQLKFVGQLEAPGVGDRGEVLGVTNVHSAEQLPVWQVHSADVC